MLPLVNITDVIDLLAELLPRRARRLVGLAFMLLCLLSTSTATSLLIWYASQESHSLVQDFNRVVLPSDAGGTTGQP